jgi:hypothetical protein
MLAFPPLAEVFDRSATPDGGPVCRAMAPPEWKARARLASYGIAYFFREAVKAHAARKSRLQAI